MKDFRQTAAESAQELIAAAFERTLPEASARGARLNGAVLQPRRAQHGDFAANHALIGAAALGMPSAELARRLAQNTELNGSCFATVAAEAGFLNFTLGDVWYAAVLDEALRLGAPPAALTQPETAEDELRLFPHTKTVPEKELSRRGDMANPVYRVRYAYARMGALIENRAAHAAHMTEAENAAARPMLAEECALIKLIAALPGECARAEKRRDAAPLCGYALRLADGFYALYAQPGYFSADGDTLEQRLRLLIAACRALAYALDYVGVDKRIT